MQKEVFFEIKARKETILDIIENHLKQFNNDFLKASMLLRMFKTRFYLFDFSNFDIYELVETIFFDSEVVTKCEDPELFKSSLKDIENGDKIGCLDNDRDPSMVLIVS